MGRAARSPLPQAAAGNRRRRTGSNGGDRRSVQAGRCGKDARASRWAGRSRRSRADPGARLGPGSGLDQHVWGLRRDAGRRFLGPACARAGRCSGSRSSWGWFKAAGHRARNLGSPGRFRCLRWPWPRGSNRRSVARDPGERVVGTRPDGRSRGRDGDAGSLRILGQPDERRFDLQPEPGRSVDVRAADPDAGTRHGNHRADQTAWGHGHTATDRRKHEHADDSTQCRDAHARGDAGAHARGDAGAHARSDARADASTDSRADPLSGRPRRAAPGCRLGTLIQPCAGGRGGRSCYTAAAVSGRP